MTNKTQEIISPAVKAWQLAFGLALTCIRGELKMNQEKFGLFLGVSRPTISAWELSNAIPTRATLSRIKTTLWPYLKPEELPVFENDPEKFPVPPISEIIQ